MARREGQDHRRKERSHDSLSTHISSRKKPKRTHKSASPSHRSNPVGQLSINEPDLDPHDLDAQIQRCKERIKEKSTMSYIFKIRLKILKEAKAERDAIISQYSGQSLDWKVIQRIELLKALRNDLREKGDVFEELSNVDAILKGYECGELQVDGQVTYWCHGNLVFKQSKFEWDDFIALNEKHQGHKGFWVEGRSSLESTPINALKCISSTDQHGQYVLPLVLRLGYNPKKGTRLNCPEIEFDFIDDTGCGPLKIYADDMGMLQGPPTKGPSPSLPKIMGYECMKSANGSISYILAIMVEVNIYSTPRNRDPKRQLMIPSWVPAVALVDREKSIGPSGPNDRLSGRWLRHSLFTATAPKSDQKLYISTHKSALMDSSMLPAADVREVQPMPLVRPNHLAVSPIPPSRGDKSTKALQALHPPTVNFNVPKVKVKQVTFKHS